MPILDLQVKILLRQLESAGVAPPIETSTNL